MPSPIIVREPARATGADVELLRVRDGVREGARDLVAVEEPLEIRLNGWRWTVTMRTPGDDADLVVGLLASEGVIAHAGEVEALLFTRHPEEPDLANVADATLGRPLAELQARLARHQVLMTSSCGLCGKSTVEALLTRRQALPAGPVVDAGMLAALPERLAAAQPVFRATGGLHAAALFDAAGSLLAAREDVGRHNATDKVLGWRLRAGATARDAAILLVSGRASFEIVQKAMLAGIPIVAAVSAPSSLAVTLAREARMTLVGFVRGGSLNVYAGPERVAAARPNGDDAATDPLEFIPRIVRDALDRGGAKISLRDWQALERPERECLIALAHEVAAEAGGTSTDGAAARFAAYLHGRILARTGHAPRPLGDPQKKDTR
jgi:FdhD protein